MILRALRVSRLPALLIVLFGFGAAPAAAQCGYGCGGYVPSPVYSSCGCCGCCGCGSAYYSNYYAPYAYPSYGGCCSSYGYSYGRCCSGYRYGAYADYAPYYYRPFYRRAFYRAGW